MKIGDMISTAVCPMHMLYARHFYAAEGDVLLQFNLTLNENATHL